MPGVRAERGLAPIGAPAKGMEGSARQEPERALRVRGMGVGASPVLACARRRATVRVRGMTEEPPNKRMKLTKLSAAWLPGWTCRLMPAPARMDAGTASQLIRGVLRTQRRPAARVAG